jgi:hypothetical protein
MSGTSIVLPANVRTEAMQTTGQIVQPNAEAVAELDQEDHVSMRMDMKRNAMAATKLSATRSATKNIWRMGYAGE